MPNSLDTVRDRSTAFEGTVLQIADIRQLSGSDAVLRGELNFGNTSAAAGITTLNRYTGIHFLDFKLDMDMDFRGSIGPDFRLQTLFSRIGDGYRTDLIDALGVDTLVVSSRRNDYGRLLGLADGWQPVEQTVNRTVLVRENPSPGPVAHGTAGVVVSKIIADQGNGLRFSYESPRGGKVLLDRLAWTGYSARSGNANLPVSVCPAGLLQVTVPAGSGTVDLSYEVPGLRVRLALLVVAAATAVVMQLRWRTRWRRKIRSWAPEVVDPDKEESRFVIQPISIGREG